MWSTTKPVPAEPAAAQPPPPPPAEKNLPQVRKGLPDELAAAHEKALSEPFDLRKSRRHFIGIAMCARAGDPFPRGPAAARPHCARAWRLLPARPTPRRGRPRAIQPRRARRYQFIAALTFLAFGGFMLTLLVYYVIFPGGTEVGQAAQLVANARFVQNVIGVFSEALGGNLSDLTGRKPFFYVRVVFQALAIAITIAVPSIGSVFVGAIFLGVSQCIGAIAPAAVMDTSDPAEKGSFVRRYVVFVFFYIAGSLLGSILTSVIIAISNGDEDPLGGARAFAIAAIAGCAINTFLIRFLMRETLAATIPFRKALADWKTLIREGLTLPIKLGWATTNIRWCMLCHLCNKYSTVGAFIAFFAVGVYRFNPPPSGLALIQIGVLASVILGQVWIALAVRFFGIGIAIGISYAIGVVAMLIAAFSQSYNVFLASILVFGIAAGTSAPMRNLFARQRATTEIAVAMAAYDIHDIIMEAIGGLVAGNVFALVVGPKGYSRGSPEALADSSAGLPLILAAISFAIATCGAVVIHLRIKSGQLVLLGDDEVAEASPAGEGAAPTASA